ncbi:MULTISPECIES: hypothetical protein [Hyphomonas]|uniref:hypothetical protein n=1 Tax=Hyphomonas TaxID=85 RepID=UPI0023571B10|nr:MULTISPECIES: hypothetical protein [Hyphomonas]
MHVRREHLSDFANRQDAPSEFPRLIRRLALATASLTELAVPAGTGVARPGWDGRLTALAATPWTPAGASVWELSCRKDVTTKANEDYEKRTDVTPASDRASTVFVFATPRVWSGKEAWIAARRAEGAWKDVLAYDAEDIETWLDAASGVALEFAEDLGLTGPGLVSAQRYAREWVSASSPALTAEAIAEGRSDAIDELQLALRSRGDLPSRTRQIALFGDSVDEAVIFAAHYSGGAPVVVTAPSGWDYIEARQDIHIAIAAAPEFAIRYPQRAGLTVIVPYAKGDRRTMFAGQAGEESIVTIELPRPDMRSFQNALEKIGVETSDAGRLTQTCGRSWSVLRRQLACNPSIRRPAWLDHPSSRTLPLICLIGGWTDANEADKSFVETLAQRPYADIEADLADLAECNDPPIIRIDTVWKAKSPLELLALAAPRLNEAIVERFLTQAESILFEHDPALDLDHDKRWASHLFEKRRAYSSLLSGSVADALVKLSVRSGSDPVLENLMLDRRIANLVERTLKGASSDRWLSVSPYLPDLAEAAPETFLKALEGSLRLSDRPVAALFTETRGGGVTMVNYFWALMHAFERIAWAPHRLTRVALVLAELSRIPYDGNFGSDAYATLLQLFRAWLPQTNARLDQRMAALETLAKRSPDEAFRVAVDLLHRRDSASPAERPHWRDDDSGRADVTDDEYFGALRHAADLMIRLAEGNAERLGKCLNKLDLLGRDEQHRIYAAIETFIASDPSVEERQTLRDLLRGYVEHAKYGPLSGAALNAHLKRMIAYHDRLAPVKVEDRDAWLFQQNRRAAPTLGQKADWRANDEQITNWQEATVRELLGHGGFERLADFALSVEEPWRVGELAIRLATPPPDILTWIETAGPEFQWGAKSTQFLAGLMRVASTHNGDAARLAVFKTLPDRTPQDAAAILACFPVTRETWDLVEQLPETYAAAYWKAARPGHFMEGEEDLLYALTSLQSAGRPRTALLLIEHDSGRAPSPLIADLLEGILQGEEPEGQMPGRHGLQNLFKAMEDDGSFDRLRLAQLEFGYIKAFAYGDIRLLATLQREVASSPSLYVDLVSAIYSAEGDDRSKPPTDAEKATASNAYQILTGLRRIPGYLDDSSFEPAQFQNFADTALDLSGKCGRWNAFLSKFGELLAHTPDESSNWFPPAVADFIEDTDEDRLWSGFSIGVMNLSGGVRWVKGDGVFYDEKADRFDALATAWSTSHPKLAAAFAEIASSHRSRANRERVVHRVRQELGV